MLFPALCFGAWPLSSPGVGVVNVVCYDNVRVYLLVMLHSFTGPQVFQKKKKLKICFVIRNERAAERAVKHAVPGSDAVSLTRPR